MRARVASVMIAVVLSAILFVSTSVPVPPSRPPFPRVTLKEFGRLIEGLSEPEGYFDTDNFISNEGGYLKVLPIIDRIGARGGVYMGVGPDQNFSYIAEVRPELAIIVDIRRQNLLEHLYFKALFELSPDRSQFLQRLFGRPVSTANAAPAGFDLERYLDETEGTPSNSMFSRRCLDEAERRIRHWSLSLNAEDFKAIEYVARAFFDEGPLLKFTSYGRPPNPRYPSYRSLLLETDSKGKRSSYLATEDRYQSVRALHLENRIVPVVADLAGSPAMGRIARELRARRIGVSCFYVSNVEFYLFERDRWVAYTRNMNGLPWEANAILIRSISNSWRMHRDHIPGYYMTTLVQRAASFLQNEAAGRNATYWDLVTNDNIAP